MMLSQRYIELKKTHNHRDYSSQIMIDYITSSYFRVAQTYNEVYVILKMTSLDKYESEITNQLLELCKSHVWSEQQQQQHSPPPTTNNNWKRVEVLFNTRPVHIPISTRVKLVHSIFTKNVSI